MREETIIKKWYKYDELTDSGKERAIQKHWDINVDYDWWDCSYEDAAMVGIDIQEFDIDRGSKCKIKFKWSPLQVAEEIIKQHGDVCETYKIAKTYLDTLKTKSEDDDSIDDLRHEFKKDLECEYLRSLRSNYEYLTSKEAIIESIESNELEFDGDKYETK
jgi:hypothetical protein